MTATWDDLVRRMGELKDLESTVALLSWDQETFLPEKGIAARGEQLATVQGILHARLGAPELGEALERLSEEQGLPPERAAILRALRHDRERALRVPGELVRELARAQSEGIAAWRAARKGEGFARFAPTLERLLALRREMAQAWLDGLSRGAAAPELYDALLEGNEEGMRVARLEPLFARLAGWLAPLVERLSAAPPPDDRFLRRRFDPERQWAFTLELLDAMGFDRGAGRQDRSIHPFTQAIDPTDVRLTTHIYEDQPLSAIFSTVHEGGHGLYEQGLPLAHRRTPVCAAASMGLHESQSRLWENLVARSLPFWEAFLPRLAALFPAELAGVSPRAFHAAVNRVERTLIRVEADEITYNLHILVRFELELALLRGALPVSELPAAWNDRMEKLLGVRPPDDARGVLQDIHWASGEFGYFPTYIIGNLYAASLMAAARRDLPGLDAGIGRGELAPLRVWLREKVHRHGRSAPAEEIVRAATGAGLTDADFRAYLEEKYTAR